MIAGFTTQCQDRDLQRVSDAPARAGQRARESAHQTDTGIAVELHNAITDGFQLARLPWVGQQELPAMTTSGTGRDVEARPSPEN